MPNDLIKHRMLPTNAKQNHSRKSRVVKARSKFAEFLIGTNFWPLVLIGKGVNCFGWGAVVAFMLGGISVYGYGVLKPLPFTHQAKTVRLSGVVRDGDQRPIKERFWVGVLANQLGPVQTPDGSFTLDVPESSRYDFALWTSPESVNFYNGMPVESNDKGLKLGVDLTLLPMRTAEISAGRDAATKAKDEIAQTVAPQ